jgi:hypothetical protein
MRERFTALFALTVVIFFCCIHPTFGQGSLATAQLSGEVTDSSGAAVAGANVTVHSTETNTTSTATSNGAGIYVATNLPPGNYELRVSFSGFANYTQTGIVLTVGQFATANVQLQVQSLGEKVVVSTEAPIIEPTKTEISQVVQTQQIESLPISNRVFTDFALLTPGVTTSRTSLGTTFTEFEVTQISFGGMRSFSNEITVDGADFVNTASGIQRATPPQESVQEFRVVNNSFGADYGRALGGIVNIVTKSGTNDFHGSIYEYFQNNALNARSLLQPAPLPHEYRQNQFGASFGGPIRKDKTFFFVNYEGKRSAQSPIYPPDLVNNLAVIDEAKALMGLAPEGCNKGLASCTGSDFGYLNGFLKTGDDDTGFARIDHQINQNNRLAFRYNVEDTRALGELVGNTLDGGGIGVPSGGRNLFIRDQSAVATVNSVLTPSLVNTVLAQYARRHYNFPGVTGQPDFSVLNDLELGHNFGTNDRLYETRAQLSESVSWVKGNHVAKFGADGNWLSSLENFPGFTPVRTLVPGITCLANFAEYYNTNFSAAPAVPSAALTTAASQCAVPQDNGIVVTYAGVPLPQSPNFQSGAPVVLKSNGTNLNTSTWANAFPPSLSSHYSRLIDHGYWGLFFQDQWRITPKLTLNYGLRWDVESGLGGFVNQDYNGWQPRVGIAYSPDSKTVVRAGFGIFDDRYNLTFFFVPNTQKVVPGYLCDNNAAASTSPINIPAVCSGAGISPQSLPDVMASQAFQGYQLYASPTKAAAVAASIISTGGYDALNPFTMAGTCFTTGACGVGNGGMDHNVSKIPYAEQASAEVERQFGGGLALDLSYLFVGAHRLVRGNNINIPCPLGTTDSNQSAHPTDPLPEWVPGMVNANGSFSSCATGTPTLGTGALAGLGPWFQGALGSGLQTISAGLLDYNNGVAKANYHGGTVTVIERVKDFSLTANYTYSHTIDNGNFTTFINLPVNQLDYAAERANSNQDARHRLVTNFTATGPSGTFARNFTFSSIITLQSGRPFTIFYGNPALNDIAGGATDRVGGAPVKGSCASAANCQTMISRNTYVGDPLYTWDFRLSRYFPLRENRRLELAVDAFNALNRPNVDEVTSVYGSPVFCGGAVPHHYNDAVSHAIQARSASLACPAGPIAVPGGSIAPTPIAANFPTSSGAFLFIPTNPNPNFGLPRTMLNPRQFQFSATFSF